jgi:hypothetical protein
LSTTESVVFRHSIEANGNTLSGARPTRLPSRVIPVTRIRLDPASLVRSWKTVPTVACLAVANAKSRGVSMVIVVPVFDVIKPNVGQLAAESSSQTATSVPTANAADEPTATVNPPAVALAVSAATTAAGRTIVVAPWPAPRRVKFEGRTSGRLIR